MTRAAFAKGHFKIIHSILKFVERYMISCFELKISLLWSGHKWPLAGRKWSFFKWKMIEMLKNGQKMYPVNMALINWAYFWWKFHNFVGMYSIYRIIYVNIKCKCTLYECLKCWHDNHRALNEANTYSVVHTRYFS